MLVYSRPALAFVISKIELAAQFKQIDSEFSLCVTIEFFTQLISS